MPIHQDFEEMLQRLNEEGVKYLIIGAHAASFYTEPKHTGTVHILIDASPKNAVKVYDALRKFGAPLGGLEISDLEKPTTVYQIGVEPVRIDILTGVSGVDFAKAWAGRKTVQFGKEKTFLIGMDDLISAKKASGRPRDKKDLEKLLASKSLRAKGKRR